MNPCIGNHNSFINVVIKAACPINIPAVHFKISALISTIFFSNSIFNFSMSDFVEISNAAISDFVDSSVLTISLNISAISLAASS